MLTFYYYSGRLRGGGRKVKGEGKGAEGFSISTPHPPPPHTPPPTPQKKQKTQKTRQVVPCCLTHHIHKTLLHNTGQIWFHRKRNSDKYSVLAKRAFISANLTAWEYMVISYNLSRRCYRGDYFERISSKERGERRLFKQGTLTAYLKGSLEASSLWGGINFGLLNW